MRGAHDFDVPFYISLSILDRKGIRIGMLTHSVTPVGYNSRQSMREHHDRYEVGRPAPGDARTVSYYLSFVDPNSMEKNRLSG